MRIKKAPDTVALFGLPITNVTMAQAVARIEEHILSGTTHQIATANLDFARNSLKDQYLQRIICECSMVLPDGAPMVWASTLFGSPLKERVTGVDLIPELAKLSAERGYGIYLLGASEESSRRAAEVLAERYPGVRIVGRMSPEIQPLHEMDNEYLLREIDEADPDILLVAFGNPKQEIWIHRHRDRLKVPVAIGIGGAFDLIAGNLKRAPKWMQWMQLEWCFRLAQEPFRLLPRYTRDAIALLMHLPLGLAANRMQPEERRHGRLKVQVEGTVRVIATPAKLSGDVCNWLVREAKQAVIAGQTMVVDMSATIRVEADGLGGLLEARRILLADGLWIWLAGMSNPVRRVLQFSAMSDLFRIAATSVEAVHFTLAAQSPVSRMNEQAHAGHARGMSVSNTNTTIARAS
jgi:N-acetylglucosaminyldiphosphoundecaprenol N-acetyl-beta-D-mannosaminyltransferase